MLRFRVLGPVELTGDEGRPLLSVLSQPRRLALLAYLALARPRGYQRRDTLLALFWSESETGRARDALNQALHFLRRALGEAALPSRGPEEVAVSGEQLWCDALALEEALDQEHSEEALGLYRGELLAGFNVGDAPEFERWLDAERARLRDRVGSAATALAAEAAAAGNPAGAAAWARQASELASYDEAAHRRVLEYLDAAGDRSGALREHEAFRRRLQEELESEPAPETAALVEAIRGRAEPRASAGVEAAAAPAAAVFGPAGGPPLASTPGAQGSCDVTPDGIERTDLPTETVTTVPRRRGRALGYATAALVVVLAGAAAYARFHGKAAHAASARKVEEAHSVAVLPFVNMSGEKQNEYFSDGITEEILDALAHVPALRVAARTSSFAFKGKSEDVGAIGQQLHVTHVLEGSLQRDGGRVRITTQLIDARTGYQVWSEQYTRELSDIFALEDEISKAIAGQLQAQLAPGAVLARVETRSEEAHELYLRGRALFVAAKTPFLPNPERQYLAAIDVYRKALALDSSYAAPWSRIARCYLNLAGETMPNAVGFRLAREAVLKALALDSTLADAHATFGFVLGHQDWDFAGAEREAQRALALLPSSPDGHLLVAAIAEGRNEWSTMAREAGEAARLDPGNLGYASAALNGRLHTAEGARISDSL